MKKTVNIAIIGAGNMGASLAAGWASVSHGRMGITVTNPSEQKLEALVAKYPSIHTTNSNVVALNGAHVVVLAVKPCVMEDVLSEIGPFLNPNQILVSVAAGYTPQTIQQQLPQPIPNVYQAIPNIAVALGQGMTFITPAHKGQSADAEVADLFGMLGQTLITDSRGLDAGMAIASCGLAYAMRYMRAATQGGVQLGLSSSDALRAVMQTLKGAVAILEDAPGTNPEEIVDRVTTPAGMTIKGLNAMEHGGFSASVVDGLLASSRL